MTEEQRPSQIATGEHSHVPEYVMLDDRYELRERIGQGGMGMVFRAHDSRLNRTVAIKQLAQANAPHLRAMFKREAEIMANVRHPNVVAVHDTGGWDSQPYLVMPFHDGVHLEHWAAQRGGPPLPLDIAIGILGQACTGVEAMHEAGVIHGDIKPRNILVSDALEVILVDLGLSRYMSTHLELDKLSGTPGYLAPEIIRRDPLDPMLWPKMDIYSLGVTTYWLLTGQTPWGACEAMAVLVRQIEGELVAPSQLCRELPSGFDAPILQALCRDPAGRPDVGTLRAQLLQASRKGRARSAPFIVVVDDDPDSLVLEEAIARSAIDGAEVVSLTDADAALSLIESRPPDLLITDLQMPNTNGVELTATLRGRPSTASIPIIVVTGVGGAGEWKLLHELGAECLVVKPLQPSMLTDAIRRVLEPKP